MSGERKDVGTAICKSIDIYKDANPTLTIMQVLSALEEIRFMLTEVLLEEYAAAKRKAE